MVEAIFGQMYSELLFDEGELLLRKIIKGEATNEEVETFLERVDTVVKPQHQQSSGFADWLKDEVEKRFRKGSTLSAFLSQPGILEGPWKRLLIFLTDRDPVLQNYAVFAQMQYAGKNRAAFHPVYEAARRKLRTETPKPDPEETQSQFEERMEGWKAKHALLLENQPIMERWVYRKWSARQEVKKDRVLDKSVRHREPRQDPPTPPPQDPPIRQQDQDPEPQSLAEQIATARQAWDACRQTMQDCKAAMQRQRQGARQTLEQLLAPLPQQIADLCEEADRIRSGDRKTALTKDIAAQEMEEFQERIAHELQFLDARFDEDSSAEECFFEPELDPFFTEYPEAARNLEAAQESEPRLRAVLDDLLERQRAEQPPPAPPTSLPDATALTQTILQTLRTEFGEEMREQDEMIVILRQQVGMLTERIEALAQKLGAVEEQMRAVGALTEQLKTHAGTLKQLQDDSSDMQDVQAQDHQKHEQRIAAIEAQLKITPTEEVDTPPDPHDHLQTLPEQFAGAMAALEDYYVKNRPGDFATRVDEVVRIAKPLGPDQRVVQLLQDAVDALNKEDKGARFLKVNKDLITRQKEFATA